MRLTPEQVVILDHARTGAPGILRAYAGTGKTATLAAIARARHAQGQRVAYVCFNRANAQEARHALKDTATATTAHALAWHAGGSAYADRLTASPWAIAKAVQTRWASALRALPYPRLASTQALAVVATLNHFCQTAAPRITSAQVPVSFLWPIPEHVQPAYAHRVARLAQKVWDHWPHDPAMPLLHDWYLKAWALTNPELPADVILFDEAQDANPVLLDLLERQPAQRLYAGDPFQQLYAWRGAVNALQSLDHPTLPLTCSWRFGQPLARLANQVLSPLAPPFPLRGRTDRPTTFGPVDHPTARLFRSNAGVLQAALNALEQGGHPAIAGGFAPLTRLLEDLGRLQAGQRPGHPELAAFEHWSELQAADEAGVLGTLHPLVRWVTDHAAQLPQALDALQHRLASDEAHATVILSTVHKAKGRQWPSVVLGQDFLPYVQRDPTTRAPLLVPDELHCLYVAVTRAEHHLDWNGIAPVLRVSETMRTAPTPQRPALR